MSCHLFYLSFQYEDCLYYWHSVLWSRHVDIGHLANQVGGDCFQHFGRHIIRHYFHYTIHFGGQLSCQRLCKYFNTVVHNEKYFTHFSPFL